MTGDASPPLARPQFARRCGPGEPVAGDSFVMAPVSTLRCSSRASGLTPGGSRPFGGD